MANIMVRVEDATKELWVAAAHDARVSLSEWIRRRCDDGLGAGDVPGAAVTGDAATDGEARRGVIPPRSGVRISPSSAPSPSLPTSVREFRGPDPKGGKK